MATIDLSKLSWMLLGWRPFTWRLAKKPEGISATPADLGPYPISLPGTIQRALLEASVIDDWNIGVQSRACEWVEHRHWDLTATISKGLLPKGERVVLNAEALDYSGWILVDCAEVARFEGALAPHRFDLTAWLSDGEQHTLSVVFEEPPREQGQFGYTSLSRFFKPRYNYNWDWTPRLVPTGIAGRFEIRTGPSATHEIIRLRTTIAKDGRTGRLEATLACEGCAAAECELRVSLRDREHALASEAKLAHDGENILVLENLDVEPWWPNGSGP